VGIKYTAGSERVFICVMLFYEEVGESVQKVSIVINHFYSFSQNRKIREN